MKRTILVICICCFSWGCSEEQSSETRLYQLYEQARAYLAAKNYTAARPLLEEAVQEFTKARKDEYTVEALYHLAQLECEVGEYRSALRRIASAKTIAHKDANIHGEVQHLLFEGELYRRLRNSTKAYELFSSARSLASAFGNKEAELDATFRQHQLLNVFSQSSSSFEELQSLLADAQRANNVHLSIQVLIALGEQSRNMGKYGEAVNYLTQALLLAEKNDAQVLEVKCLRERAYLSIDMRKYAEATDYFTKALNKAAGLGDDRRYEVLLLFDLAQHYERMNQLTDAKRVYTTAIEKARYSSDRLSEYYLSLFLVRCNFRLFTPAQRDAHLGKLIQSYEQLAQRFQSCFHATGEAAMYVEIGKIYEQRGSFEQAYEYYQRAVEIDQKSICEYYSPDWHTPYLRALNLDEDHSPWYALAAHALVKLKRYEEALTVVEQMLHKRAFNSLVPINVTVRNASIKEQMTVVREALQQVAIVEYELGARRSRGGGNTSNLSSEQTEYESLRTTIEKQSQDLIATYRNVEPFLPMHPPTLGVCQKAIPRGSTVLEYCVSDNAVDIFVITPSALRVQTINMKKDSLQSLLNTYLRLMHDPAVYAGEGGLASLPAMTRFAILSAELYDVLFRPVEQYFNLGVIIIPGPVFEGFPLHALERQEKKSVQYIIDRHTVDYLPTLSSLLYATKPALRMNSIVAFGNPSGKNWSIDYELRDIRSFSPSAKVFVGLEVSWNTLKTMRADVLQLAMGMLRPSPQYPLGALIMSDGLTLGGISPVAFEKVLEIEPSPLVLLTNQGEHSGALNTLHAHLLRVNGVSDVICNFWSADRKAAKYFSEFFYSYLSQGLAPGDAYRQALLQLIRIREVNHQRSWAQYFHYGVG